MVLLAAVFIVSALLELVGVALVVRVSIKARRSLEDFRTLNPDKHSKGSYAQAGATSGLIEQILADQALAWWAVAALVGGIVVGLVGNLLSLVQA